MRKPEESIKKLNNPYLIISDADREALAKYIEDLEDAVLRLEEAQTLIYGHLCEITKERK